MHKRIHWKESESELVIGRENTADREREYSKQRIELFIRSYKYQRGKPIFFHSPKITLIPSFYHWHFPGKWASCLQCLFYALLLWLFIASYLRVRVNTQQQPIRNDNYPQSNSCMLTMSLFSQKKLWNRKLIATKVTVKWKLT